jgi:hypothetical protein
MTTSIWALLIATVSARRPSDPSAKAPEQHFIYHKPERTYPAGSIANISRSARDFSLGKPAPRPGGVGPDHPPRRHTVRSGDAPRLSRDDLQPAPNKRHALVSHHTWPGPERATGTDRPRTRSASTLPILRLRDVGIASLTSSAVPASRISRDRQITPEDRLARGRRVASPNGMSRARPRNLAHV